MKVTKYFLSSIQVKMDWAVLLILSSSEWSTLCREFVDLLAAHSTASGSAGDLAGTITTSGAITLVGGGGGTSAIGQFVSEITIK